MNADSATSQNEQFDPSTPVGDLLSEVRKLSIRLGKVGLVGKQAAKLTSGERIVLGSLLRFGPTTVPNLGRRHGTSRQNIQIIVNRLSQSGLVRSRENPAHKRSGLMEITPEGETLLLQAEQELGWIRAGLRGQISDEDLQTAVRVLSVVSRHIESGLAVAQQPCASVSSDREASKEGRPPAEPSVPEPEPDSDLPVNLL